MKAVGLTRYLSVDESDCFLDVELDKPEARGHDILVKIKAVSVNPVDTKVRRPKDKIEPAPRVLGWDAAGEVVAIGEDVANFSVGDSVYYAGDLTRPGVNAEFQLVDERIAALKPNSLTFEEAASLPLTAITAWECFFDRMSISKNPNDNKEKSVLIIAGAGGVGSIASQIAKNVAGFGTVISTASREASSNWCLEMGADLVVDHSQPLLNQLKENGINSADYILCCAPTEKYFDQMVELITPQGAIGLIVETTGNVELPMNKLQTKSVRFCWEFMYTRSMFSTDDIDEQHKLLSKISQLIDSGELHTTLNEVVGPLNAQNLTEAHRKIESGTTIGKIALSEIQG